MVWLFTLCWFGLTKTMGKKRDYGTRIFVWILFWSFWRFLFKENPRTLITYRSQPRDISLQMISSTNYSDASGLTVFNTYFFFYTHKIKQQYGCSSRCLRAGLLSRPPACDDLSDSLNGPLKWQWRHTEECWDFCVPVCHQTRSCTAFHKASSSPWHCYCVTAVVLLRRDFWKVLPHHLPMCFRHFWPQCCVSVSPCSTAICHPAGCVVLL